MPFCVLFIVVPEIFGQIYRSPNRRMIGVCKSMFQCCGFHEKVAVLSADFDRGILTIEDLGAAFERTGQKVPLCHRRKNSMRFAVPILLLILGAVVVLLEKVVLDGFNSLPPTSTLNGMAAIDLVNAVG